MIVFLLQDIGRLYGAERATLDLARGLVRAGQPCSLWLIEESRLELVRSELKETIQAAGLPLVAFPVCGAFSPGLIRALRDRVRREKPAAVHTIGPKATVHAALALRGRVPLVSTVHGWLFRPDLKERFYERLELWAFRSFDRVITLSRYYENFLDDRLGAGRVVRIPSGFETSGLPSGRAALPSDFTIGMLGRLSWEKNHAIFLGAARRFLDGGGKAGFLVAGEGAERARLETRRRELALDQAVVMPGYLPSADFFRQVAVLVQCSRMENLPYSLMEAMAWQRPVIATRVGGMPDLVEDGRNGFLVAPNNEEALALRMIQLAADHELAVRMGKVGRAKLESEFAPAKCISEHNKLYQSLGCLKPES